MFFNRNARRGTKVEDINDIKYELGRSNKKIADNDKYIRKLQDNLEIQKAQIESAQLFITALCARIVGGQIPVEGEIVIPKSELAKALSMQKVGWYEDKENDQIVIVLEKIPDKEEAEKNDMQPSDQGKASTEGNNDSNASKEGNEQELHASKPTRGKKTRKDK